MNDAGDVVSPTELAEERFLARAEKNIRAASTKAVEAIVKIGFELTLVKAKVGHGKYETFVRDRFGWSASAAHRFVQVFEMSKSLNVGGFDGLTIDASSLYLIAAPSTPPEAREAVLAQAATPEGISHAETKQVVADHKTAAAPAIDGAKPHWDNQLPAPPVSPENQTTWVDRIVDRINATPPAVDDVVEQYRALVIAWDGADVSVRERFLAESMDEIIAASSTPILIMRCARDGGCNSKPECADITACHAELNAMRAVK